MLIAALLDRPWARGAAWTFTKERWQTLLDTLGTFQGIPQIVTGLGAMCAATDAADVNAFFARNPVPAAQRGLQQSIERIASCAALDARQSPALAAWLAAR